MQHTQLHMDEKWWGRFEFGQSEIAHWQIGPLALYAQLTHHEWRIGLNRRADSNNVQFFSKVPATHKDAMQAPEQYRYSFSTEQSFLLFTPVLADRDVVSRPDFHFAILPGEKVTVYMSTPLWVRVETGAPQRILEEFPIVLPSDTWFGESTIEGELCYASKSTCRLDLDELPHRPHRATTAVSIENHGAERLLLENIKLPVRFLSLYAAHDGRLWTESVVLKHDGDSRITPVHIERAPPSSVRVNHKISWPRESADRNLFVRTFSGFFT